MAAHGVLCLTCLMTERTTPSQGSWPVALVTYRVIHNTPVLLVSYCKWPCKYYHIGTTGPQDMAAYLQVFRLVTRSPPVSTWLMSPGAWPPICVIRVSCTAPGGRSEAWCCWAGRVAGTPRSWSPGSRSQSQRSTSPSNMRQGKQIRQGVTERSVTRWWWIVGR